MLQLAAASDQGIADGALTCMKAAGLGQNLVLPDFSPGQGAHA
jgi:hypothetical protein